MNVAVLKRPSSLIATNFVPDDVAKFQTRGVLLLKAGRDTSVSLSQNQLSEEDRTKLKVSPAAREEPARAVASALANVSRSFLFPQEVAAVDGLYRIRVPRVSLQAERQAERQAEGYLTTFVRAVRVHLQSCRYQRSSHWFL